MNRLVALNQIELFFSCLTWLIFRLLVASAQWQRDSVSIQLFIGYSRTRPDQCCFLLNEHPAEYGEHTNN